MSRRQWSPTARAGIVCSSACRSLAMLRPAANARSLRRVVARPRRSAFRGGRGRATTLLGRERGNEPKEDRMDHTQSPRGGITRRAVVAAAAGTAAFAADPAAAQRCPPAPAERAKGPLVWMNMDQQELDDAYDNDVYAFNSKNILARQRANNEIARAIVGAPMRVAYGPAEIEQVDVYKCQRDNAPVMV